MLPFNIYIYIFGKRKWKFVFLGRQTINGNRRLLCQQTCPSTQIHMIVQERYNQPQVNGASLPPMKLFSFLCQQNLTFYVTVPRYLVQQSETKREKLQVISNYIHTPPPHWTSAFFSFHSKLINFTFSYFYFLFVASIAGLRIRIRSAELYIYIYI
jgi:hypothetical protein